MKTTIAIILSLLSAPAYAQYYVPQTQVPVYVPPPVPQTYQTYGTTTYGSDGSVAQQFGNRLYVTPVSPTQPQIVCQTFGTQTVCQ